MKIRIRAAAVGGVFTTVLADESVATLAAAISGYVVTLTKSPQKDLLAQATGAPIGVSVQDIGNAEWKMTFGVERVHATPDAASLFIETVLIGFAAVNNWDLEITIGAQVTFLVNAVVTAVTPNPHSDQSSFIKYEFTSGLYTTVAP